MKQIQFKYQDIDISLQHYANTILIVISQLGKFGSYLQGECEVKNQDMNIYEIKTLFGNRELMIYELIARAILQEMYNDKKVIPKLRERLNVDQIPNLFSGKTLSLFISYKGEEVNKEMIQIIGDKLIELF